jgi:hypothetical protein
MRLPVFALGKSGKRTEPAVGRRPPRRRQAVFGFVARSRQRQRRFKQAIILLTCGVVTLIVRTVPWGRYLAESIRSSWNQVARSALGVPKSRPETDEEWRRFRELGIEMTRPSVIQLYTGLAPPYQKLMRHAGLDPDHCLLRWGNFDWTLLLPSAVFQADETGRSYRLRPFARSIWLSNVPLKKYYPVFFLVPEGPGLAQALAGTQAIPVASSLQTTNSWGLRGPEPELDAPLRGIVLGDSFMQGMLIGDDETPPESLKRYLHDHLKLRVSILNTGLLGYGPEQYYYTLREFADRFKPDFVIVSVFANDFGGELQVEGLGVGDWQEGKYWLQKIVRFCQARRWTHLIVPAPNERSLFGIRRAGNYPGLLSNILDVDSLRFLDPIEDFADALLKLQIRAGPNNPRSKDRPLFNDAMRDYHFSAAGSRVWAEAVGSRLLLLLRRDRTLRGKG